jgi:hypothetical protein
MAFRQLVNKRFPIKRRQGSQDCFLKKKNAWKSGFWPKSLLNVSVEKYFQYLSTAEFSVGEIP